MIIKLDSNFSIRRCLCVCGYYGIPNEFDLDCEFINPIQSLRFQIEVAMPISSEQYSQVKNLEYDLACLLASKYFSIFGECYVQHLAI